MVYCRCILDKSKKKGSQLRHSTLTKVKGRAKPALSVDYIVGLVDGEGCFYVNISESKRYRAGARVGLSLHVKMQARDREVLKRVKRSKGCGAVYFQKEQRDNHTQCHRYTVGAQRDVLKKVIPFFHDHPLQCPSKRQSFKLFCQIADLVERKEHLKEKGIEKIRLLKSKMNQRTVGLA